LLLHELAHLACANKGHGAEFQQQLVEYVRKYVSITHAAELAQLLK
jgi:predicted metal-dependent hydrolase